MDTADFSRRLENLIRLGHIMDVDHASARCRVKSGKLESDWLPWIALRAGKTRDWNPPTPGEQCLLLSPSGATESGVALIGIYSTANPAPSNSPDEHVTVYPDGASIRYNHATGTMLITGIKTFQINASESITLDTPQTHTTGRLTVRRLLTYLAGLIGLGTVDDGSGAHFAGDIDVDGNIHATGSIIDDGGNTPNHSHPEAAE